ncbi:MAG: hypothetical protein GTO41_25530 [Burkholderiales bacterium]|nr:hypothetical protein [Burkholderiales bacterium]
MKIQNIISVAFGYVLACSTAAAVELYAGGKTEAEIRTEIVIRCQSQMGEWGVDAIDICVKAEHQARAELEAYPDEFFDIVRRCNRVKYNAGWSWIKLCADNDIAARDALSAYPQDHDEVINACNEEKGRYGYSEVKQCVDERIALPNDAK